MPSRSLIARLENLMQRHVQRVVGRLPVATGASCGYRGAIVCQDRGRTHAAVLRTCVYNKLNGPSDVFMDLYPQKYNHSTLAIAATSKDMQNLIADMPLEDSSLQYRDRRCSTTLGLLSIREVAAIPARNLLASCQVQLSERVCVHCGRNV
jgi:hypothetical protein